MLKVKSVVFLGFLAIEFFYIFVFLPSYFYEVLSGDKLYFVEFQIKEINMFIKNFVQVTFGRRKCVCPKNGSSCCPDGYDGYSCECPMFRTAFCCPPPFVEIYLQNFQPTKYPPDQLKKSGMV